LSDTPFAELLGRTPLRGVWRRTHVNTVPHIFPSFSFGSNVRLCTHSHFCTKTIWVVYLLGRVWCCNARRTCSSSQCISVALLLSGNTRQSYLLSV